MLYAPSTKGFYNPSIHPVIPADAIEIHDDLYATLLAAQSAGAVISVGADGIPVPVEQAGPDPTAEAAIKAAVQAHLDATALAHDYDSIAIAVTYADEPSVPKYQMEGQAFRAWRSLVWSAALPMIDGVHTVDDVLATLPAFALPGS